jgi:tetratricopeptide (TPR) repeat protein
MKKYIFSLAILGSLGAVTAKAQMSNVQSAIIYEKARDFAKAKEKIDLASENPSSNTSAKTWFWKGKIYWDLYGLDTLRLLSKDPLSVAVEAFQKCVDIDKGRDFGDDSENNAIDMLRMTKKYKFVETYNNGIAKYNKKEFDAALADFESLIAISPNDSDVYYKAGLFAEKAGKKEKARTFYRKAFDLGMKKAGIFSVLASMSKADKDTAQAIKLIQEGRAAFPKDQSLIIEELSIYLSSNQQKKALELLDEAIKIDPKNHTLYFAAGKCFEDLKDLAKAREYYQMAIDAKPDYFDALYNLGAIYFNKAAETQNAANKLPTSQQKKFDEMIKQAKDEFKRAQPYFEQALDVMKDDRATLIALKELYAKTNQLEKSAEMKARLDAQKK